MIRTIVLTACLLLPAWSAAEIEKTAVVAQGGTHLMWWPRVTAPAGWHVDKAASQANAINMLVPDGATFSNAATVMYAKAIYKPRDPGVKSLQALIQRDENDSKQHSPGLAIEESSPLPIADGTALRTFTFFPAANAKGNWEAIAYGEDGDYYLMFVMSSRTLQGYQATRAAFGKTVASYTREPKSAGQAQSPAPVPGGK